MMKILRNSILPALPLLLLSMAGSSAYAQSGDTKPDNTKINQRDKNANEATADNQKMNPEDRALSAKIRRSVMADKTLSTYAHNIKIVSQDGTVTLKGPVRSDSEIQTLVSKAVDATGSADKVVNQLAVKQ
jgi:hyperosmotically inducible periplasmic protein